jgi:hypothetical protein
MSDKINGLINHTTWGGVLLASVGTFSVTEWLGIVGGLLAIAGFFVNVWFKRKLLQIADAELDIKRQQARLKLT